MGFERAARKGSAYVFRGLPLVADSRTLRNGSLFSKVVYCTWEKSEKSNFGGEHVISFPLHKDGGWLFLKYPLYIIYLFLFSLFKVGGRDVCVCMDLDTFIPVWAGSFFKKSKLIFDVVDPASQARFKKVPFPRLIDKVEIFFIKKSFLAIFPHESRLHYYHDLLAVDVSEVRHLVIENMPSFPRQKVGASDAVRSVDSKSVIIGYFGTLDASRGLDLVVDFVLTNPEKVELLVAGDGPLKEYIEGCAEHCASISYVGRYTASQLEGLYSQIDFSWMYYDPSIFLHKYAAPNKFYEHLCFRIPAITNRIIPQASFILENRTGVIVDQQSQGFIRDGRIDVSFLTCLERFVPGPALNNYWDSMCVGYYDKVARRFSEAVFGVNS